ncbi:MAG: amino acid adenylation domain-containing protein, partial [Proteobacteria bacterium]|nr:amino acid adenylation domain-containing protein [Pseudomonadota bacterium]
MKGTVPFNQKDTMQIRPEKETLSAYFSWCAGRYPDRIALDFQDESVSYRELQLRADQFAVYLRAQGVLVGDRVGIYLPRGIDMFVGLLGILKSGAAYVPLDPSFSMDRVQYIVNDCQARLLLTTQSLSPSTLPGITCIYLDEVLAEIAAIKIDVVKDESVSAGPEDLAYIIYTSGTTGRPKGVMIQNASICHFIRSESSVLNIHAEDKVFQGFSLSFDMSIEEIWTAFWAGARLLIASYELMNSGPELAKFLAQHHITVWHCVPTLLAMQEQEIPSLRLINLGGEACPPDLVLRWFRKGRRILNTYGPTETTVTASFAELRPGEPVTIGRALPGYTIYVLDENLQPVAKGEEGELCIAGPGLALGYVNLPELTQDKFRTIKIEGESAPVRIYRSGDLVRLNEDDQLIFLGRLDTQIKIRGFRVELAEIESVLMQQTGVQSAVVALLEDAHGIKALVAFVSLKASEVFDETETWAQLRAKLPNYMLPAVLSKLDEIPLLPSGKVDRKQLLFPQEIQLRSKTIVKPKSLLEMQLHSVWTQIFAPLQVSIDDDFFLDLGGHSLRAALMVSQLRKDMGLDFISMKDVYQFPSIRTLAAHLEKIVGEEVQQPAAPLFQEIPVWRYRFCMVAQAISLFFIFGIFSLQWLLPYLSYSIAIHDEKSRLVAFALAFLMYAGTFPVILAFAIASKWILIGRYKLGDYPLWGSYYLRWWMVRRIQSLVPDYLMRGTPLINLYWSLLGARIGKNVYMGNVKVDAADLLEIGDGSSIGDGAMLSSCSIEHGYLRLRRVTIGSQCVVGQVAGVGLGARLEDGAELDDLSLLPDGQVIPGFECWAGSPAKFHSKREQDDQSALKAKTIWNWPTCAALSFLSMLLPLLALAPIMPGLALFAEIDATSDEYMFLLFSPVLAFLFAIGMGLQIVCLKWLIVGRMKAGRIALSSFAYVRYWFVSRLMDISLELIKPVYATLYASPWYRALGVRVGKRVEISTASSVLWDLLSLDDECFVADGVSLGAPRVADGAVELLATTIGKRTFLGNSALVPAGAEIADKVLIGCLSVPPKDAQSQSRSSSSWFGSPALFLPHRQICVQFDEGSTFRPPRRLYLLRLAIEFVRILLPLSSVISISSFVVSILVNLGLIGFSYLELLLILPFIALGAGLLAGVLTIIVKRQVIGVYSPTIRPLWSTFVWGSELVTCLYENLAVVLLLSHLRGTPFINIYLRALGCKIGKRVYTDTTDITEFDVVTVGDDAALNEDCGLQTHLFEDRVMKISNVNVGARCSIGAGAI